MVYHPKEKLCCIIAFKNKDKPHSAVNFAILLGFFFQVISVQSFSWLSDFNSLEFVELQAASVLQVFSAVSIFTNLAFAVALPVVQWTAITRLATFWLGLVLQFVIMVLWAAVNADGSLQFISGWIGFVCYIVAVILAVINTCKN